MKIGIIWAGSVRFAALVGSRRKKVVQIYVVCHASHFYPVFSKSTMPEWDYLEPIFHFHWPSVYSESATQPQASVEPLVTRGAH